MKSHIVLAAILALAILPASLSAQNSKPKPGLYSVVDGKAIPVNHLYGKTAVSGTNTLGLEISHESITFAGETSGTPGSDTFLLVFKPGASNEVTPLNMKLVPLMVDTVSHCRAYDPGSSVGGYNLHKKEKVDFTFEKIRDDAYRIDVPDLTPGEYGFVFRGATLDAFHYNKIYGFTIAEHPEQSEQPAPAAAATSHQFTPESFAASFEPKSLDAPEGKFNLWNGNYDKTNWAVVVGYVNKSWRCTYKSGTQRENFFGDTENKYFHGWQIGALYTPSFDWGLGLRTGLFLEFYTCRASYIREFCNRFTEADLYIPLHASFRIPFAETAGLTIFGGAAFQWATEGKYYRYAGSVIVYDWRWWHRRIPVEMGYKHEYGYGWPQKVNWQAECGLNFRFKMIGFSFTYSFGLVDHGVESSFDDGRTYETASDSRQDKMQASVMITF